MASAGDRQPEMMWRRTLEYLGDELAKELVAVVGDTPEFAWYGFSRGPSGVLDAVRRRRSGDGSLAGERLLAGPPRGAPPDAIDWYRVAIGLPGTWSVGPEEHLMSKV